MSQSDEHSRIRQLLTIAVIGIIIAIIAAVAWSARPGQDSTSSTTSPQAENGSQASVSDLPVGMIDEGEPKPGDPAPDFVLPMADGTKVQLSGFEGRPVFLNFWADWCPFCKQEMPDMQAIQDEFGEDVVVIGVNVGDPVEVGESFVDSVGVSYTILYDTDLNVNDGYDVQVMPTSYFIDAEGNIADFNFGVMSFDQMMAKIDGLMDSES